MGEVVSRKEIGGYVARGLSGIGMGVALFFLNGLGWLPALIVGGIMTIVGWNSMTSSKTKSPFAGLVATAAGLVTMVSAIPLIGGLAGLLLTIGGLGSLVFGGFQLFKGLKGFQSRT